MVHHRYDAVVRDADTVLFVTAKDLQEMDGHGFSS
jgi:hypothetical protein